MFTLPNGMYNLVLFSCGGTQAATNNQGTLFTVNGVTQTALPTTDTSFILNNNYVVFTNVVVSTSALWGTWSHMRTGPDNDYGSLNGAQIQYLAAAYLLSAQPAGNGQLNLQWPRGTLLEATNINGPWSADAAEPPYLVSPTGEQRFFRVKVQ